MKYENGKVTRHTEAVYLLFKSIGWIECEGHILTLYNYHFSIVPFQNGDDEFVIQVSDMLSGSKVVDVPVPEPDDLATEIDYLDFCGTIVRDKVKEVVGNIPISEFDRAIKEKYIKAVEMYGPKPIPETNRG